MTFGCLLIEIHTCSQPPFNWNMFTRWILLTALGCIKGRSCAGHTGCSGKHGRPNQRGSPEETGNLPQVWWWTQFVLKRCFSHILFQHKRLIFYSGKETATFEEAWDIFKLRDVVLPTLTVFGQQRQVLQVFLAGVSGVQLVELPVHDPPSLHFLLRELNARDRIPTGGITEII